MSSTTSSPQNKIGILIVGLGGNNGVTLLAGYCANRRELSWETAAAGRVSAPVWQGCITQLDKPGVGFKGRYPDLANAAHAAIGGWDIRPTRLGDALYESRVLDYDLVRQVREEMNEIPIWKGVYDASFLGESQHATATHIVEPTMSWKDKVEHLRNDIRTFRKENNITTGHITVIWSASVERPSETEFKDAQHLLDTIYNNDDPSVDVSPSIMYAVAAAMEGCSFVNGGSQNTLSSAMAELYTTAFRSSLSNAEQQPSSIVTTNAYLLGTDFKAGQTKFKTAAVEYLRALGLKPRVIASSNHLGNNDMLNLTSKKTVAAKMRVKSNIFEPWREEQLDHQVRVMYTDFMLDEKRDVVEYTSLGFLHCPHTMLTYTRCMDSVLCVPLMVDAAVWCDWFARRGAQPDCVAKATAYLFKVPESWGAQGIDPGFHRQMAELERALQETLRGTEDGGGNGTTNEMLERGVAAGIITQEQLEALQKLSE